MIESELEDGTITFRPESECKGCYDRVYRPHHVKGVNKVRSSHEKKVAA